MAYHILMGYSMPKFDSFVKNDCKSEGKKKKKINEEREREREREREGERERGRGDKIRK